MSDRLTDEDLDELDSWGTSPNPSTTRLIVKEVRSLRAENERLAGEHRLAISARNYANDMLDKERKRLVALRTENVRAYHYAENFLRSFVSQHFPPNPDWKPLPDLLGVLTQIDNATTITRDLRAENERLRDERGELTSEITSLEISVEMTSGYAGKLKADLSEALDQRQANFLLYNEACAENERLRELVRQFHSLAVRDGIKWGPVIADAEIALSEPTRSGK